MPVPPISYPDQNQAVPLARQACPACQFIDCHCPPDCVLARHFRPETNADIEPLRIFGQSVTFWILNLARPYQPAAARAVVDAAARHGVGFSDRARALLVEALLTEVARRDAEPSHRLGLDGIPIVESLSVNIFCCVSDLSPIDHQLEVREMVVQEALREFWTSQY